MTALGEEFAAGSVTSSALACPVESCHTDGAASAFDAVVFVVAAAAAAVVAAFYSAQFVVETVLMHYEMNVQVAVA